MIFPRQVTTKADVIAPAGSKAVSTACLSFAASICAGRDSCGRTSPAGHGLLAVVVSEGVGSLGAKCKGAPDSAATTHPCRAPTNWALRTTPFGVATSTVFLAASTTGLPRSLRTSKGGMAPAFATTKSASRPEMKTPAQTTRANAAAWWLIGSPGGATYPVENSRAFARATRASRLSGSLGGEATAGT